MVAISRATALAPRTAALAAPPTLKEGARGASVVTLQNQLKAAGFDPGAADGAFGPKTTAAVKAFQRARGLEADGVVGPKTWAALSKPASGGSGPTLKEGARGEPVRALQNRLNQLGYNVGAADGAFGPKTEAAVKAFQRAKGLTADGVVGPKTWDKLGIHVQGPVSGGPGGGGRVVTGYVQGQPRQITLKPVPGGKELRADAADAFNRMHAAARRAGINITVNSGFRSMEQQRALYQAYQNGTGNLAARPGYSNHQGGIAVDMNVGGTGTSTYRWLANNAASFGFKRTVPSEPWHWEYRP
jgi:peptidoglycan hydrolase-like protein with peptidoglycan-binding domain